MSDFQAKNWPKFSLFDSDVSMIRRTIGFCNLNTHEVEDMTYI